MALSRVAVQRAVRGRIAPARERIGTGSLTTRPAPWGGLNTRDAFNAMKYTDARSLINLIPVPGALELRKGSTQHSSGVGSGDVPLIAEYHIGATRKLIAASASNIYDATSGEASASSLGSGFNEGRWDTVVMDGKMGFVNGTDAPQEFDGSALSGMSITGPTASNLIGVHVFKERSYFWEKDDDSFWYSALSTLGGTLSEINLSRVADLGGNIKAMQTWSLDGGAGLDDYLAIIMSTGHTLIWKGASPADSAWSLVGVYKLPPPLSRDAAAQMGGDLVIATQRDYITISGELIRKAERAGTLQTGKPSERATKMSGEVPTAVDLYGANEGWQTVNCDHCGLLIINVPVSTDGSVFHQHVLSTSTGGWTIFKGMNARAWGIFNGALYFGGGGGKVYKANDGFDDSGNNIEWEAATAWDNFKTPRKKRMSMVRPVFTSDGTITLTLGMAYDFGSSFVDQTVSATVTGTAWGDAWGSPWSPAYSPQKRYRGARGAGEMISLRLRAATKGMTVKWHRTDFVHEAGGVI